VDTTIFSDALQAVFALRYQVYCIERKFLSQDQYSSRRESDAFDPSAIHFAAFDTHGRIAGSARLARSCGGQFPFQKHCSQLQGGVSGIDPRRALEVSRLVVSRHYTLPGTTKTCLPDRPILPGCRVLPATRNEELVLGLYRAMYQHSRRAGIDFWYAAMERSLVRLLSRYGITFAQIGPEMDYFGPVSPYCARLDELEVGVRSVSVELHAWFQDEEQKDNAAFKISEVPFAQSPKQVREPSFRAPSEVLAYAAA
jgi:N-acyl amino acid synthase of PEP-CTERM/exosortase system